MNWSVIQESLVFKNLPYNPCASNREFSVAFRPYYQSYLSVSGQMRPMTCRSLSLTSLTFPHASSTPASFQYYCYSFINADCSRLSLQNLKNNVLRLQCCLCPAFANQAGTTWIWPTLTLSSSKVTAGCS